MMKERLTFGENLEMDTIFVNKLLQLVHKESIKIQTNIMQNR